MKRRTYVAVSALVISGVALACELITLPPPLTLVQVRFGQTAKDAIGEVLQVMYGNAFNSNEVFMEVAIRGPLGGAVIVPFTKPCGENFKGEGAGDYGGGGATDGSGSNGGGTFIGGSPFPTNPNTGIVTIGQITEEIIP